MRLLYLRSRVRAVFCGAIVLAGALPAGASAAGPNGFDVRTSLIPRDQIHRGGPPRDGIPALDDPKVVSAAEAGWLHPSDRVVGVVSSGGEARAYPLRILVWHEIVSDTLGGRPVAVTWCPLCGSALVFDRRVDGKLRTFGVSGLLYQSNLLMYDRETESLWSQGGLRAVTGAAARDALELTLLGAELLPWARWRERHPGTTVLSRDTGHVRDYGQSPYAGYAESDALVFPVETARERPAHLKPKDPMVVVQVAGARRAYAVRDVARAAGDDRVVIDHLGGRELRLVWLPEGDSVRVETAGGDPVPAAYMYWFSLASLLPEVPLWSP